MKIDGAKVTTVGLSRLLISDELGSLPLCQDEASLFFRLLASRYERGSLIVSNIKSVVDWREVLDDHVLVTAILDPLLHHANIINVKGESYRLHEKNKAGLLERCWTATDEPTETPT